MHLAARRVNDVTHPAWLDSSSSICDMLATRDADQSNSVTALEHSMRFGYTGIDKSALYRRSGPVLSGDAKMVTKN
ncbi:hypothetical protein P3H15_34065 [Rhodococcus sp. T2V]|uniref:hypothetical protein n=1 Tax=Rhodococcus sp. T2V TaxID=3034164 RepID=UPI0023E1011C|nr:hypothetical protein [Rhodococcus sp. T2V]MDF3310045.1 hypothetical protein [Rhodococcus sp. T2V]